MDCAVWERAIKQINCQMFGLAVQTNGGTDQTSGRGLPLNRGAWLDGKIVVQ